MALNKAVKRDHIFIRKPKTADRDQLIFLIFVTAGMKVHFPQRTYSLSIAALVLNIYLFIFFFSPISSAAIIFSESGSSPSQMYEETARYTVESLWPNTSASNSIADSVISFYYTDHARENLDTLAEEMSEVGAELLMGIMLVLG